MKKAIIAVMFVFLAVVGFSQDRNNEIYVNYGAGTFPGFAETFGDIFEDFLIGPLTGATVVSSDISTFGVAGLGYKRNLNEKITLGLGVLYQSFNMKKTVKMPITHTLVDVESTDTYITGMVRFDFNYVRKEWVTMYSGVALGACYEQFNFKDDTQGDDNTSVYFAFQVNAFGIRIGKAFGGFAEVGFGYAGIVNAGLSYKF
ncbi:MAG: hypothetical protein KKA81_03895 [Bacteroidetes bacterium]|nr:hypothetical protein [Bacteroidota bacterium]